MTEAAFKNENNHPLTDFALFMAVVAAVVMGFALFK